MPAGDRSLGGEEGRVPSGRTASRGDLRRTLASAPPSFLEEAMENPAMGEAEILLLLRNRVVPPGLLARVGKDPRWSAAYAVKKGVARHPHTPAMVARDLLGHLQWADLAEIAEDAKIPIPVRRHAG